MKQFLPLAAAIVLFSACGSTGPDPRVDALAERVKQLETQITGLHEADTANRTMLRLVSNLGHFYNTPWEDFLSADEFWENTYEVDPFACLNACASMNRFGGSHCYNLPLGEERDACLAQAKKDAIDCISGCKGFPRAGGGGPL